MDWCLDLDGNPSTGTVCGGINGYLLYGADAAVAVDNVPGRSPPMDVEVKRDGAAPVLPDVASSVVVDDATSTLCVTLPRTLFADTVAFRYTVGSIFGGSSGRNDAAPDEPGFDRLAGFFASDAGDPGPCGGSGGEAGPPGDTGGPPPATGGSGTGGSTVLPGGPAASASVQSPWWVLAVLVVTLPLAIAGVARRRRKTLAR